MPSWPPRFPVALTLNNTDIRDYFMSNAVTNQQSRSVADSIPASVLSSVLLDGDLARLSDGHRVEYMMAVCRSLGLNPATKPFEFIKLNGKLVMYAKRDCTEQLRKIHGVSITIKSREVINGVYVVTANAQDASGRVDESTGAVPVESLKGEALANAYMKAETKAKRRVTLSICGLGLLDETEVESVRSMDQHPIAHQESEAPAKREKIASLTGETKTKKPEWPAELQAEAGEIRAELIALGGDAADKELKKVWRDMAYDNPADTVEAFRGLLARWQEFAADAEAKQIAANNT